MRGIFSFGLMITACFSASAAVTVPDWVEPEWRFAVTGTVEEVSAVNETLKLMCDVMKPGSRELYAQKRMTGPLLQWMARMGIAQTGYTNQTGKSVKDFGAFYMADRAHPEIFKTADFSRVVLTNASAKAGYLPTVVRIEPVFGKGYDTEGYLVKSISEKKPTVDYPSELPEVVKVGDSHYKVTLRAPQNRRTFRFRAKNWPGDEKKLEYRWLMLTTKTIKPRIGFWWNDNGRSPEKGYADITVDWTTIRYKPIRVAVFSRRSPKEPWGLPAIVEFDVVRSEKRRYENNGRSWVIDYGAFRDEYELDEKGKIYSIERFLPGAVRGEEMIEKKSLKFEK